MDAKEVIKIRRQYKVVTKGLRPEHGIMNGSIVTVKKLEDDPIHGLCADVLINGRPRLRQWVNCKELEHI